SLCQNSRGELPGPRAIRSHPCSGFAEGNRIGNQLNRTLFGRSAFPREMGTTAQNRIVIRLADSSCRISVHAVGWRASVSHAFGPPASSPRCIPFVYLL